MKDKARVLIAGVMLAILAGCLIWKSCTLQKEQTVLPPLDYSESTVTASNVYETATTHTDDSQPETEIVSVTVESEEYQPSASEPWMSRSQAENIAERVRELHRQLPDFVGWLYMADSDIDYPVVQGTDNEYYLSHAPDGSYYRQGTLFLDYRCYRDLTSGTNIIFGHNMQQGMFGDIRSFRNAEAFERHRYGWFFTPDNVYRIDFFALSIVSGSDVLYDVPADLTNWYDRILETAEFRRDAVISEKMIALSTCASDFRNARALFVGDLIKMDKEENYIFLEE